MRLIEAEKKLLKNPEFRKEYLKQDLGFEIARIFIKARIKKGLSQKGLAELIGTKQPAISRIESGRYSKCSIGFLERVAKALNTTLVPPSFAFLEEKTDTTNYTFIIKDGEAEKHLGWENAIRSMVGKSPSPSIKISN